MKTFRAALAVLAICGCGSQTLASAPIPAPPTTTATLPSIVFPQVTLSPGGVTDATSLQLYVKWDLFQDPASGRFVLLGGAGCSNGADQLNPICLGVPGGGAAFLLVWPKLPFSHFCIDTLKVGTKQPSSARASGIVLATSAGRGQPSISVQASDGSVHIDRLCYPHRTDATPYLWIGNSWCEVYTDCGPGSVPIPQVMTFAIAGEMGS